MRLPAWAMVLLLGILSCYGGEGDYSVVLGKQTDSVEFAMKGRNLEIEILSPGGIGRLELRVEKEGEAWPEAVVLVLRSEAGKPLKELEGFSVSGTKVRIQGSRRTSGKMDCHEVGPGGQGGGKHNPRKVKVLVEKTATAMRVTIPGRLLKGESGIKIQWVDYYR